jgi:RHS repeat-associated protein
MGEENNQLYYYHGDHLGSAQIVTDPEGKIYEQLEYTPYGELWVEHLKTTIETTPFRFTGKERDSETGLYYFGARYLNPQTNMWLSADPAMGEYIPRAPINDDIRKQNQNLSGMGGVFNYVNLHAYHYAGNNPVKLVDPNGERIVTFDIVRQSDPEVSAKALGGRFSWDKAASGLVNSIGRFGCKLMACLSIGNAILQMKTGQSWSLSQLLSNFNNPDFFTFEMTANKIDENVWLNGDDSKRLIISAAGTNISFTKKTASEVNISERLESLNNDSTDNLILLEVATNNKGGTHFFALNKRISIDAETGEVKLLYDKQYDGFARRRFAVSEVLSIVDIHILE